MRNKKLWPALVCVVFLALIVVGNEMTSLHDLFQSQEQRPVHLSSLDGAHGKRARLLEVHFLDVGQGDCGLVFLPGGKTMLIDAGNNEDAGFVVGYLKKEGIRKIDFLVGTHPHEDHIGGLDMVIKSFPVGEAVYLPRVAHTTKTYFDLLNAVEEKKVRIVAARAGMTLLDGKGVRVRIIAPCSGQYEEINDYSAVVKIEFGKVAFLFAGDATRTSEREMLASAEDLGADVLKVGHHGSKLSTSNDFLRAVNPTCAVISSGVHNDYGYPHPEVLDRLDERGVRVFRTDSKGTIIFISDGEDLKIKFSQVRTSDR